MLPPKLPKKRGRLDGEGDGGNPKVFPAHRRFVRGFGCSVPACPHPWYRIEFAHYRTAANSGTGTKPPDWFGLSLCPEHHREQHQIGQKAFEEKYQFSMAQFAAEFAKKTTDKRMREAMNARAAE